MTAGATGLASPMPSQQVKEVYDQMKQFDHLKGARYTTAEAANSIGISVTRLRWLVKKLGFTPVDGGGKGKASIWSGEQVALISAEDKTTGTRNYLQPNTEEYQAEINRLQAEYKRVSADAQWYKARVRSLEYIVTDAIADNTFGSRRLALDNLEEGFTDYRESIDMITT